MCNDDEWISTSDMNVGQSVDDGGFYFNQEELGASGRFDTFREAKETMDYEFVLKMVSGG